MYAIPVVRLTAEDLQSEEKNGSFTVLKSGVVRARLVDGAVYEPDARALPIVVVDKNALTSIDSRKVMSLSCDEPLPIVEVKLGQLPLTSFTAMLVCLEEVSK